MMDTFLVQKFLVSCLLINWLVGLVHSSTYESYCESKYRIYRYKHVNICQNSSASLGSRGWRYLVLETAGVLSPKHDIECKCYLSITRMVNRLHLYIDVDGKQNAGFEINGRVYNKSEDSSMNIKSKTTLIMYRQNKHNHQPRVCMSIYTNTMYGHGNLTVRCEANRRKLPRTSTTERQATTTLTRPLSGKALTRPMQENNLTSLVLENTSSRPVQGNNFTRPVQGHSLTRQMKENTSLRTKSANSSTRPISGNTSTIPMSRMTSIRSLQEMTSTIVTNTEGEVPTNDQTGIVAGITAGVVIFLIVIVVTIVSNFRRIHRPTHSTTHTEISETSSIHIYEEMESFPISQDVSPASIGAEYVYSDSYQPVSGTNDDINDEYEKVSDVKKHIQYISLDSAVDSEIIIKQHSAVQEYQPQLTHIATRRNDAQKIIFERFELSSDVSEASVADTHYLYDDTGLPMGDMASVLYINDNKGDTYGQLSEERKCREHRYVDLESPEGSDYEDCEIVTRQPVVTRAEQLLPTRATTGIDAHQTNYNELNVTSTSREASFGAHYLYSDTGRPVADTASADYLNNHGNGYEHTLDSEIGHQYLELGSPTGSDYADCKIINDI